MRIKLDLFFKLSYLSLQFVLTLGYLNQASNNPTQELTIYTKHPSRNLVIKHKTIKFDVVGLRTATKFIQIN